MDQESGERGLLGHEDTKTSGQGLKAHYRAQPEFTELRLQHVTIASLISNSKMAPEVPSLPKPRERQQDGGKGGEKDGHKMGGEQDKESTERRMI